MRKNDSLWVRFLQVFGFGKSISRVDEKFRQSASLLLLIIIACITTLFYCQANDILSLINLLYEHRINVVIFISLLFLIMQAFKIIYALFFNISSIKNTWGVLQELIYLNDWQRASRIIILIISTAALIILFIFKGFLEFLGVDSLGPTSKISAGAILIATILLLNSLKEIIANIVEFRTFKQKDFPYRVTQLSDSELKILKAPLNDETMDWKLIHEKNRLTYHSNSINNVLFESSLNNKMGLYVNILETDFDFPDELDKYREIMFRLKRRPGNLLFNEKKVRLVSDLDGKMVKQLKAGKPTMIDIQPTYYYDSLCTNEMMLYSVFPKDNPSNNEDLWRTYVKDHSSKDDLPTLEHLFTSRLSNHIGINILAITKKGRLVIQKQGAGAIVNPGRLVPSSSGSLDWEDVKVISSRFNNQQYRLVDILMEGMVRELKEEDGFHESTIYEKWVIGYSRDLVRGGKPDFYGVCIIDDVKPTVSGHESKLVDLHALYDLNIMGSHTDFKNSLESINDKMKGTMSQFLSMNMEFLIASDIEKLITIIRTR